MKRTTLAIAILFSLAGQAQVLAEEPVGKVIPLAVEVVPIDVEAAAQQAVEALPATAAGAGQVQPPPVPATTATEAAASGAPVAAEQAVTEAAAVAAEATATAAAVAAEPGVAETPAAEQATAEPPAEAPAAGADMAAAPPEPDMSGETAATDSGSPAAGMPGMRPCPKYRMGMGMGGMQPGCDHRGKGMPAMHAEVVERLDMIEARMAKIEAMLESLMKRE